MHSGIKRFRSQSFEGNLTQTMKSMQAKVARGQKEAWQGRPRPELQRYDDRRNSNR